MPLSVHHRFVSAKADDGDTSLVRPSDWNDDHVGGVKAGPDYWRLDSDFFSSTTPWADGAVVSTSNGTGSGVTNVNSVSGHPGLMALQTGTTSSGRCALNAASGHQVVLGGGKIRFGVILRLRTAATNALSNGTDRYTLAAGFGINTGAVPSIGILFRYSDNIQSGKWEAASYTTTPGTDSNVDTGVTVAMDTWYKLEFEVNAAGTEIKYYINDSLVHTEMTNIETGQPEYTLVPLGIFKALGTSNRFVDIDAFWYEQVLTTAR